MHGQRLSEAVGRGQDTVALEVIQLERRVIQGDVESRGTAQTEIQRYLADDDAVDAGGRHQRVHHVADSIGEIHQERSVVRLLRTLLSIRPQSDQKRKKKKKHSKSYQFNQKVR